jgi:hypothetical protein
LQQIFIEDVVYDVPPNSEISAVPLNINSMLMGTSVCENIGGAFSSIDNTPFSIGQFIAFGIPCILQENIDF